MSDNRKKSRRRRSVDETPELTAIEKSIAKYLRFQCPTKKGMLMGMQVAYFNGSKAVECLTESKWSSISKKALDGQSDKESKNPVCFSSKHDAVQMLRKFSEYEMFRRVVKVYKEEKSSSDQTSSNNAGDTSQSNTPRPVRQRKTKTTTAATTESTSTKDEDTKDKDKDKSKKKKFKFELHDDQTFVDSPNEFYVWIYSPTTVKQYIMGALLVIGCIGVCLFPLWPAEVRTGVYYLSMVLASLLGVLLSLAVVKYIIFAGVWLLTLGKIKFWLLPNLTEDVGFFESFVPLYVLNVTTKKTTKKNGENKENEDDEETAEKSTNKKEDLNEDNQASDVVVGRTENRSGDNDDDEKEKSASRSSSIDDIDDEAKPQKSSDEDFEMLSKDELETK